MIKKRMPLFKCNVIHSIPGRIRLGCRALKYLDLYKEKIKFQLENIRYIKQCRVNIITKNLLIYYDDKLLSDCEILEIVEESLSQYSLTAYKLEREELYENTIKERSIEKESVGGIAKRITLTAGALTYSIFNKKQVVASTVLEKFTTVPAVASIYLSLPFFKSGLSALKNFLKPNADTLTATSIVASILAGKDVSALTIILLSDAAELLTSYTMEKTRNSIKDMLSLNEQYVWKKLEDGSVKKVKIDLIKKGDNVVIHTGEKICVDGNVLSGEAVVDQSAVTGEFMPAIKRTGDKVFAGTVVKNGNITVATEKAGDDTVVSRIVSLIEDASHKKAPIQNYADKFSSYLIPFNFMLSGITYLVTRSAERALNMLVIDYSCGIRLSTAAAFSASINTAVKNGVLVKGGNYIEALSNSDTLILDKTGTLTEGKPQVSSIETASTDITEKEVIEIASAAEETSKHPMALAVLTKVRQKGYIIPKHGETKTYIARGTETNIGEDIVRVGSRKFMIENYVKINDVLKDSEQYLLAKGESVIYVAKNDLVIGILGIQDKMRENMKKSLNNLRYQGISDIVLLTGDCKEQAEIVADKMYVDSFEAELLPEDKAKSVLKLQSKGSKVIMVGDGVNDAPALAYSDVGVALGRTTTDIAIEVSDVTIQGDDPMVLPTVVDMSKKTMNIINENFGLVISINTIGLLLGAVGVLPVFWGAVLHNSSTIFVIANSLRLLFYDMERG
ncbi:copper-exporting P-type ATPase A [Clostridium acetireducens DSM 10703]|jgi:cation-transporting P-type ATPase C|uniref:Cd(2+)-exporting ATPase n=1 Tax=Clostridium acetireducens DSM 10703 TaxID=1121290 RepID=A0A1E8EYI6_9CLOT|nr:heavy metal translocating P-type ATPase [Clostridium acetireducens]OFI06044.1 copper-exporting P-type ATPase A [Clostridium acetireducens DSM 10703]